MDMEFTATQHDPNKRNCSFCNKSPDDVFIIIEKRTEEKTLVAICEECVYVCFGMIVERGKEYHRTLLSLRLKDDLGRRIT
jgi:ATP-dependent protease Clp ATPase subunit